MASSDPSRLDSPRKDRFNTPSRSNAVVYSVAGGCWGSAKTVSGVRVYAGLVFEVEAVDLPAEVLQLLEDILVKLIEPIVIHARADSFYVRR